MNPVTTCRTVMLAGKAFSCAARASAAPPGGAIDPRLLEGLSAAAAEEGAQGRRLIVVVYGHEKWPRFLDLGIVGDGSCPKELPAHEFSLNERVTDDKHLLLVTVDGAGAGASVMVETFELGQRHGFLPESPAATVGRADGAEGAWFYRGMNVNALSQGNIGTFSDLVAAAVVGPPAYLRVDPCHEAVIGIVERAEAASEAISVSAAGVPDMHLVRRPGDSVYILMDDAGLQECRAAWQAGSVADTRVRIAGPAGECSAVRRLGGLVEGFDADTPGICVSRIGNGGQAEVTSMFCVRGREIGKAVTREAPDGAERTGPTL